MGKTTFAYKLELKHAAIRFSHDEWMRMLFGKDPPAKHFADYVERVSSIMEKIWVRGLEIGVDVIPDFGFWSRTARDRVRALIATIPTNCKLYCFSCPDDIAWQRIERRNGDLSSNLLIAPETYQSLKARFEPLGPDEVRINIP